MATNGHNTEADRAKAEIAKLTNRCAVFKHNQGLAALGQRLKSQEKHIPIIDQIECLRRFLHYPFVNFFVIFFLRFYWKFTMVIPCLDKLVQLIFAIGGIIIVFISPFGLSLWDAIMCKILDLVEHLFPGIKSPVTKVKRKTSETEAAHPECICQKQNKRCKPSFSLQNSTTEELGVDKN